MKIFVLLAVSLVAVVFGLLLLLSMASSETVADDTARVDTLYQVLPFPVPVRVEVPVSFAVPDEEIGAYRVDQPFPLYCFPIDQE